MGQKSPEKFQELKVRKFYKAELFRHIISPRKIWYGEQEELSKYLIHSEYAQVWKRVWNQTSEANSIFSLILGHLEAEDYVSGWIERLQKKGCQEYSL